MRMIIFVVAFLFVVSLASADVGPGPEKPDIIIRLTKNDSLYGGISSITYHCNGSLSPATGAVEMGTINLSCTNGICKNDNWYYKFNPCFYSSGYFSYEYDGKAYQTEWLNLSDSRKYDYKVDVETGAFTSQIAVPKWVYDICFGSALILPLAVLGAFATGRN